MSKNIEVSGSDELKELINALKAIGGNPDAIMIKLLHDAGNMFFSKVKKRTIIRTGQLNHGWDWANTKKRKTGTKQYELLITNPVEYAEYVEFGHRTPNGKNWVEGRFWATSSAAEVEKALPKVLKKELEKMICNMLEKSLK